MIVKESGEIHPAEMLGSDDGRIQYRYLTGSKMEKRFSAAFDRDASLMTFDNKEDAISFSESIKSAPKE